MVRGETADSCITGVELAQLMERMFGPVFAAPSEAELAIEVTLERDANDGAWLARVAVSDAHGTVLGVRVLRDAGASCRALDRQLVLVVAMAIDPEIALDGLPPELAALLASDGDAAEQLLAELRAQATPAAAEPETPSTPAAEKPAPRRPASGTDPPVRVSLSAALGLTAGTLPGVALGALAALSVAPALRWPIELSIGYFPWSEAPLEQPLRGHDGIGFSYVRGALVLCPQLLRAGALEAGPCAGGFVAGRFVHAAEVLETDAGASSLELGPVLAAQAALRLDPHWQLTASAAGDVPMGGDHYSYLDGEGARQPLFRPARIALTAQLGVRLAL